MPKNTPTKSSTFLEGRTITKVVNSKRKIELQLDDGSSFSATAVSIGYDGACGLSFEFSPVTPTFTWQELPGNLVWNFHKNWIQPFDAAKSPEDLKPIGLTLVSDKDLWQEMCQRCKNMPFSEWVAKLGTQPSKPPRKKRT